MMKANAEALLTPFSSEGIMHQEKKPFLEGQYFGPHPFPTNARLIALVATHNRHDLLVTRSLPSIFNQVHLPDLVVIVNDSTPDMSWETEKAVEEFRREHSHIPIILLRNERTKGASGAWNTGLYAIHELHKEIDPIVAVLDDDDEWQPNHLSNIVGLSKKYSEPVVMASAFHRNEGDELPEQILYPPEKLNVDDFLIGNPGIQGSNLAANLSAFIQVGGFDENLTSCTDRDLCLRWIDADVKYQGGYEVTVRHFAEQNRKGRLSTPGSRSKHRGLDVFWKKWHARMTQDVKRRFLERAERLFNWQPETADSAHAWFVVGITSDASAPDRVEPLLRDLLTLSKQPAVKGIDVILLENGHPADSGKPSLQETVTKLRAEGLRIVFIPSEKQIVDAYAGAFGEGFTRDPGRAGIAVTRSMVQAYVYAMMQRRSGSIGWILDDDLRLGDWCNSTNSQFLVNGLTQLLKDDIDVVLGSYSDAAPLPMLSMIRMELLDLEANLRFLLSKGPDELLPDRSEENIEVFRQLPDAYHSLSSLHSQHLETPIWLCPLEKESMGEATNRIAQDISGLLNGKPLFRRLTSEISSNFPDAAKPSLHRGGSTWILNADVLADTPNLAAIFEEDPCRRSDMIWALVLEKRFGRRIVQVPVSLTHDRTEDAISDPWRDQIRDIRGHALFHALSIVLEKKGKGELIGTGTDTDEDLQEFTDLFRKRLRKRTSELDLSLQRVRTLISSIKRIVNNEVLKVDNGWAPENMDSISDSISSVMNRLEVLVSEENTNEALSQLKSTPDEAVIEFLNSLPLKLRKWKGALSEREQLLRTIESDRISIAEAGVRKVAKVIGDLHLLGEGREGVVFHDGKSVYKWFDALSLRVQPSHFRFLRSLIGKLQNATCLPNIQSILQEAGHIIITYSYQPSEDYSGGNGPGIFKLLQECHAHGIAFNNLHPDNLRVAGENVLLIDIGADIVPWSEDTWYHMINRAWLSWRWWFRDDLKALMTRSLSDTDLPELDGVERLYAELNGQNASEQFHAHLLDVLGDGNRKTVLDYGCGKGRLVADLSSAGWHAVGWDPDKALQKRWDDIKRKHPKAVLGRNELLDQLLENGAKFDMVVCSLVLCILENEEYETTLKNLSNLVSDNGKIVITVCNPFQTFGGSTPFKSRPGIQDHEYDEIFNWIGYSGQTGNARKDIHRPLRILERDLARHGFRVLNRYQSETIDLNRFEPASDFVTLELEKSETQLPATLAIKTCAMDHRTLEHNVRHIVGQLEGPEVFHDRILVVDSRTEDFAREHDCADMESLKEVIERLLLYGWMDRVVHAPLDADSIKNLNKKWFDLDSVATHSLNGSPTSAALMMFEEVKTPVLLQVDSDMMFHRQDPRENVISKWIQILMSDPNAITISIPFTSKEIWGSTSRGENSGHRIEVRASMIHMERFTAYHPFPNSTHGQFLQESWHRSFDQRIKGSEYLSLRIGDPQLWTMHPQNSWKQLKDEWLTVQYICQRGPVPEDQYSHHEWSVPVEEWLGPKRNEPFVFILQGRNISPGRMRRAIDSIQRQTRIDYGAIIIDDGSSSLQREWLELQRDQLDERWTVLHTPLRRRGMANLVWAVSHICTNPDSIILLVDLDDCLIGNDILDIIKSHYDEGADLTVGSLLRTDKQKNYMVQFDNPRQNRGGNIWLHLRTFRKSLFDRVPDNMFRLEGEYVPVAQDWAFMLPMVELATHPVHIQQPLYLYEPQGDGRTEAENKWRLGIISKIFNKQSLKSHKDTVIEVKNA